MNITKKLFIAATTVTVMTTASYATSNADMIKEGEKIFNTKKIGNCLACHAVEGKNIDNPGSLGPKLVGLAFWDSKDLYNIVYDPYETRSKISAMPSFGKNGWLTDHQIKAVVAYLKTIK
jgi:sulfur-oxidizing protein SoxX